MGYVYPGSKTKAGIEIDVKELEIETQYLIDRMKIEREKLIVEQGMTRTAATEKIIKQIRENEGAYKSAINKQIKIISEQIKQAVAKPIRAIAQKEEGALFEWKLGVVKTEHCPDCSRMESETEGNPLTISEIESFGVGLPREGLTECNIGCRCMLKQASAALPKK